MTKSFGIFRFWTVLAWAAGCGAQVGAPGRGTATDQLLAPDATGWVDRSTTGTTGIQGQWHAWATDWGTVVGFAQGSCPSAEYGECSIVEEPAPGSPYVPTAGLGMCTSGVIARWIAGSDGLTPDGSPGWAGIALDLSTLDRPKEATQQPYDAEVDGVTGFAFEIDSEPAPGAGVRVEVESEGADPASWAGIRPDASPIHAGHNEFRWDEVDPTPFHPTALLSLAFLVSGNDSHATSYAFCIDRLTALRSESPPPEEDQLLVPSDRGWVARATTGKTGIQGTWYAASDRDGCQAAGYDECSVISEPVTSDGFPSTDGLGMCTSGRVAQIVAGDDGELDWSIWGAQIGFLLNLPDFGGQKQPYDAVRHGVTGFAFDIDSEPAPGAEIQVNLTTAETEENPAFWGGSRADRSPVHAGHNEFRWKAVGGPHYLDHPPPFDPRRLTQIDFLVPADPDRAKSYSFCIKNLTALRH